MPISPMNNRETSENRLSYSGIYMHVQPTTGTFGVKKNKEYTQTNQLMLNTE